MTYADLKYEGKDINVGDQFIIHGFSYSIIKICHDKYCLNQTFVSLNNIFSKLGISGKDLPVCATRAGNNIVCNSLEDLRSLIIFLYEIPEFKVGDKVKILPKGEGDYEPVAYADRMCEYSNDTIYTIRSIDLRNYTMKHNLCDSGDPHVYGLKEVGFFWTTQMIAHAESVSQTKAVKKESVIEITPSKNKKTFHINL